MKPTLFFYCESCGELDENQTRIEERAQTLSVREEPITVQVPVRICLCCGEVMSDTTLNDALLLAVYNVYRKRHNLIFPAEIRALRERYGLSQKNLALLLGLGEVTVHRYERGALAEAAPSNLLRLMNDPANMQRMLGQNGGQLPLRARTSLERKLASLEGKSQPKSKAKRELAAV